MLNPKGWQTYIILIIGKPVYFTYFYFHIILKLDFYKPTHSLVKRIQKVDFFDKQTTNIKSRTE